ncbi:30S ribosomal protein S7 [bacterium]|nr:30S ribosomal protein S7 [bacterium]|tara:strand:- start:2460 stop:2927 length:468 start_codon:yes stop_codon:yes gene_type:complete
MRGTVKNRNIPGPDHRYDSEKVSKFINYIMERGKKNTARTVLYGVLDDIKEKDKKDPLEVFEKALKNASPQMEVRSRRIGGANYQVPREVRPERQLALSMRWILEAAKSKKGSPIRKRLYDEIIAASNNEGDAVKKKENVHKMAEANRAFAHFAF